MTPNIQGLTCDENGYLYAAGSGILRKQSFCCAFTETYLGDLPSGMECLGDITYRQGKFYMSATGNKLVEVDMKDPMNSEVVMDFPPGTLPIHGLATVQLGCDSAATYAIGRATDHSVVYEIDFDNWTLTEVCDLAGLSITGAGSQTECALPPCAVFIDLDEDNSSLGFWGNHCVDTFCTPPVAVADTDVVVLSGPGFLDSVTLQLVGMLDGGGEFLSISPPANINVLGNGTASLTLLDGGSASLADFEDALRATEYHNTAFPPTWGKRLVHVTGWAGGEASPVSTVELPLSNDILQLQADPTGPSCHGLSDGSIAVAASGGTGPYTFQWAGGFSGNFIDNLPAGAYPVNVTDSLGCAKNFSIGLTEPDTLTAAVALTGPAAVCGPDGSLGGTATGGTPPLAFAWATGQTAPDIGNLGPGSYLLTVTDSLGCTATAPATIAPADTVLTLFFANICESETYPWQGGSLATDTLACTVFTLPNGCDSTACLDLTVDPLPTVAITALGDLCTGDEVMLSAGQHSGYTWSTGETTAEITTGTAGSYAVTVTNGTGCTATAATELLPGLAFTHQSENPACDGSSGGRIEVTAVTGGTPPFAHSIDGVNFAGETIFESLPPGTYPLTVADAAGCAQTVAVTLTAPASIVLDAGPDREIALGESVSLTAVTNLAAPSVLWQPPTGLDFTDQLQVLAQPTETTLYLVQVQDDQGCTATDEVLVTVEIRSNVYAPTAFSPNGDGINDSFRLFTDSSIKSINYLRVFDRWGGLAFEKLDFPPGAPDGGWDGYFRGKPALSGIYVFSAEVLRVDGAVERMKGEVVLVR